MHPRVRPRVALPSDLVECTLPASNAVQGSEKAHYVVPILAWCSRRYHESQALTGRTESLMMKELIEIDEALICTP